MLIYLCTWPHSTYIVNFSNLTNPSHYKWVINWNLWVLLSHTNVALLLMWDARVGLVGLLFAHSSCQLYWVISNKFQSVSIKFYSVNLRFYFQGPAIDVGCTQGIFKLFLGTMTNALPISTWTAIHPGSLSKRTCVAGNGVSWVVIKSSGH